MSADEKCLECGAGTRLVREEREIVLGSRHVLIDDEFLRCDNCGEIFYLPGGMEAAQRRAAEKVRAEEKLMRPEEIRALRELLSLTQAQFEQVLNVGPKTVVRWERGTVFQSGGVNTLLRALQVRPDLLPIIAAANGVELPEPSGRELEGRRSTSSRPFGLLRSAKLKGGGGALLPLVTRISSLAAVLAIALLSGAIAAFLALTVTRGQAKAFMAAEMVPGASIGTVDTLPGGTLRFNNTAKMSATTGKTVGSLICREDTEARTK
jgi:HTH-type transcriptional regulator/antitoxin MqsA